MNLEDAVVKRGGLGSSWAVNYSLLKFLAIGASSFVG